MNRFTTHLLTITSLLMAAGPVLAQSQRFRGITEPYKDATISATVAGRVSFIKKKEGTYVKKGDVILWLEKEEEELEAARRKLLAQSKVELNSAKQQMDTLKLDYIATKQLFEATQSVSEEELWKKELDYKMAIAEYERLKMMEEKETLEHKIAVEQLKDRVITAPFNGIVAKIHLEAGESTSVQDPLVRVVDTHKCRFITYVEAVSAPGMEKGKKVSLAIEGPRSSTVTCQGEIEFASPVVDPSSGLREIKVLFKNPKNKIQPGVSGAMVLK